MSKMSSPLGPSAVGVYPSRGDRAATAGGTAESEGTAGGAAERCTTRRLLAMTGSSAVSPARGPDLIWAISASRRESSDLYSWAALAPLVLPPLARGGCAALARLVTDLSWARKSSRPSSLTASTRAGWLWWSTLPPPHSVKTAGKATSNSGRHLAHIGACCGHVASYLGERSDGIPAVFRCGGRVKNPVFFKQKNKKKQSP